MHCSNRNFQRIQPACAGTSFASAAVGLSKVIICAMSLISLFATAQPEGPAAEWSNSHGDLSALQPDKAIGQEARGNLNSRFAPPELQPRGGRFSFHLHADQRSILTQVFGDFDILVTLDSSVRSRTIDFDGDDLTFADAKLLLRLTTATFVVPLGSHRVLVAADTAGNRSLFERLVTCPIHVSTTGEAEDTEVRNIAQTIFGVEKSFAEDDRGRIIIRASEETVNAMSTALADLFQAQSELQLDVQIYEVDRTAKNDTGTVLPNSATLFNVRSEINSVIANNASLVQEIIASGLASPGDYSAILAALLASGEVSGTVFNDPFVLFGGGLTETGAEWNTTSANMLLSTSDVRSLNQMQTRITNGHEATFRSGQRYPVMTSSYTGISSGSSSKSSTLTVPQVQYQDLGLTLKVRPSIENAEEVALNIDLRVASLAGSTINSVPVLANRQYSGVVTTRFGNSALIVSAMSRQDAGAITGYPGLNEVPGLRSGMNHQDSNDTLDLVILVTPHLIRYSHPEKASATFLLTQP